jgi:hypothetical protein
MIFPHWMEELLEQALALMPILLVLGVVAAALAFRLRMRAALRRPGQMVSRSTPGQAVTYSPSVGSGK